MVDLKSRLITITVEIEAHAAGVSAQDMADAIEHEMNQDMGKSYAVHITPGKQTRPIHVNLVRAVQIREVVDKHA